MLAVIRAILHKCARYWEWLDRAPAVRLLKEPTRRIRFLSRHQAHALLRELPSHLREMATFTLATGLRAANATGLTWDQVDLSRKLARTSLRNIWRSTPPTRKVTAQIRHNQRISAAQPDYRLSDVNEIYGGQGLNRTADTRIFSPRAKTR